MTIRVRTAFALGIMTMIGVMIGLGSRIVTDGPQPWQWLAVLIVSTVNGIFWPSWIARGKP